MSLQYNWAYFRLIKSLFLEYLTGHKHFWKILNLHTFFCQKVLKFWKKRWKIVICDTIFALFGVFSQIFHTFFRKGHIYAFLITQMRESMKFDRQKHWQTPSAPAALKPERMFPTVFFTNDVSTLELDINFYSPNMTWCLGFFPNAFLTHRIYGTKQESKAKSWNSYMSHTLSFRKSGIARTTRFSLAYFVEAAGKKRRDCIIVVFIV